MQEMKPYVVEIAIMGKVGEATSDRLKASVDELFLHKAKKFPPDSRFDWSTATCNVVDFETVKTPISRW